MTEADETVGLDVNHDYLTRYRGARRQAVRASADSLPFGDGAFAEARCAGLLHHLPDPVPARAPQDMRRAVPSGARVRVFDNVWPRAALLRPLAWALRRLDRGDWVRSEAELRELVGSTGPGAWQGRRFTYTYTGLEGILLTLRLP